MSISTQLGDTGQTSLVAGTRVSKTDPRVEAFGTVDELISQIGLARALANHDEATRIGRQVQGELFSLAESLASEQPQALDEARVQELTGHVDRIERQKGVLIDWAVPGDDAGAAAFDVARTVCRRAERLVVALREAGAPVDPTVIAYLNRLSDLLWLIGRVVERDHGVDSSLRRPGLQGPRWSRAWP